MALQCAKGILLVKLLSAHEAQMFQVLKKPVVSEVKLVEDRQQAFLHADSLKWIYSRFMVRLIMLPLKLKSKINRIYL